MRILSNNKGAMTNGILSRYRSSITILNQGLYTYSGVKTLEVGKSHYTIYKNLAHENLYLKQLVDLKLQFEMDYNVGFVTVGWLNLISA